MVEVLLEVKVLEVGVFVVEECWRWMEVGWRCSV